MNIKKKLYSIKNALSPDEVFLSKDYLNYLHEILKVVTRKYNQKIDINVITADKDTSASTNGSTVIINYNGNAIAAQDSIPEKNYALIGTLLHEAGHILYSDFTLAEKCMRKLIEEKSFMPMPDINDNTVTMCDWIARNGVPNELTMLYKLFDNVIEDGNVDRRIMVDVPGYGVCRKKLLKWYGDNCPPYDDLKKQPMKSIVLCNMILAYAKYGIILSDDKNDELVLLFFELKTIIDEAIAEKSSYERKRFVNNLFASFFHIFIKDMENHMAQKNPSQNNDSGQQQDNNSQSANNNSGQPAGNTEPQTNNNQPENNSGQSMGSTEQQTNQNSSAQQASNNNSQTNTAPAGNQSQNDPQVSSEQLQSALQNLMSSLPEALTKQEAHSGNITPKGDNSVQPSSSISDNQSVPDKDMEKMLDEIAFNILSSDIENGIDADIREICEEICHDTHIHNGIGVDIIRAMPNHDMYDAEAKDLNNISRRLTKNYKREIIERQLGDCENGLYFGKQLCSRQLYREDKKIFEKKTLPEDIPDMEVVLLTDLSGSMSGERIEIARKTASILYAFCHEMNIRVSVYGHHVVYGQFTIETFADADSIDSKDKYRIYSMGASGCNRDGLAVRFCMEKLARSTSAIKLLTVISDGRPNHGGYGVSEGKADIQDALTKYGKNGIRTITAAIGEDIEAIKTIYEHKYASVLDISDLNRLPSVFPKIIKKML